jgi:hypothetical protein
MSFEQGVLRSESWFRNGCRHRENSPQFLGYGINREIVREEWYKNGKCHRISGPAIKISTDSVQEEKWYKNCELHRHDGPATTTKYKLDSNQVFVSEDWYLNGERFCYNRGTPSPWERSDGDVDVGKIWYIDPLYNQHIESCEINGRNVSV